MIVYRDISEIRLNRRSVVTVGSFDGVHRGHRVLLDKVTERARQSNAQSIVVTFGSHPRAEKVLTTEQEKLWLLEQVGIDIVVLLSFDEVCQMEAEEFVKCVLIDALRAECVIVGFDHRFGRGRKGDIALLREMAGEGDFEIEEVAEQYADGQEVSSTLIREAVREGNMGLARQLLGHPFVVFGVCLNGEIEIPTCKMLPIRGEYNVDIYIDKTSETTTAMVEESKVCIPHYITRSGSSNILLNFND